MKNRELWDAMAEELKQDGMEVAPLIVDELMQFSKVYERDYRCDPETFEWCLDVAEECGGDPLGGSPTLKQK